MRRMLKKLRLQLTLLYLGSSIILALLVGGGAYSLVTYYFLSSTDQALKVKMGTTLLGYGIPLPADLQIAVANAGFLPTGKSTPGTLVPTGGDHELGEPFEESEQEQMLERESGLADIYMLSLNIDGTLVSSSSSSAISAPVNFEAINAAEKTGSDFRTFTNQNGIRVRLFTYVIKTEGKVRAFQAGRFLTGQQFVLSQLLRTMIIAGALVTLLFGLASWLLAGRTIKPSEDAFERQQIFIANASHELRTPLTLIHAGVELGLRRTRDKEQQQLLSDVLEDANYMKKLIEDLLLLSRLDAKSLKLVIEPVQIDQLTSDVLRSIKRLAKNKEINIDSSLESVNALVDPVRMKQVLLIILDNALRNSPENSRIEIAVTKQNARGLLRVTDHGQGISKENLGKVFDRFYKVDDRSSQEYRGSGLGLSIARSLVEAQKGSISITSAPGEWTTVTISLPLAD